MKLLQKKKCLALLLLALWMPAAFGAPTLLHEPIRVAEKGKPLGVRATVRDAGARVESVSLFYAASRGMTPFRIPMSTSGAGTWYATVPGHMIGPGAQLYYYVQAENADGETAETDWHKIRLVEPGVAPEEIPAASTVARQAQQQAVPAGAQAPAAAPVQKSSSKAKYLIPAAVIVGGAVAVGGALALSDSGGGGGGGSDEPVTDGNWGGNYDICFEPTSVSNTTTVCDEGLVNIYVTSGSVEVIGMWGSEVLTGTISGSTFSAVKGVSAQGEFPEAHLIVSGEFSGSACTARVDGYSKDTENPGTFSGQLDTTKR